VGNVFDSVRENILGELTKKLIGIQDFWAGTVQATGIISFRREGLKNDACENVYLQTQTHSYNTYLKVVSSEN
jgi:hypothetical protein